MTMRITGPKLARLNTIIATQVERNKLTETLKSQYKDADKILVKDDGGLCLAYTPVFGNVVRGHSIRYPRVALEKFNEVEENRELDPAATATLKAQLDAWIESAVKSQSITFTENDVVQLVTGSGPAANLKVIYKYQVNGALVESALERTSSAVFPRRNVASIVNGVVPISATTRATIIQKLLDAVNGVEELTANHAQLFADEIQLPEGKFVEGHTYIATIHSLSLDYFGAIGFTISAPQEEPEEPVTPPAVVVPVADLAGVYNAE